MPETTFLIVLVVAIALLFDFTNGWNDAANAIATVVSTRVLSPFHAIILGAVLNFAGAYISTRVAKTIGGDITDPTTITQVAILASMLTAAGWTGLMTRFGLPISASHSLIGGLIGATVSASGFSALKMKGITKILLALILSPLFGLLVGFLSMFILLWVFHRSSPARINRYFGKLQLISAGFMALSHGTNDAQKAMGVITMALVSGGFLKTLEVPLWVMSACALAIALGTAVGGWRVIRTLGMNLLKLQPVHGFAAETSASIVLLTSASLGLPVSTTHIITSSIMGVGSTRRLSAVRWGIVRSIIIAWIFTLPACAVAAGVIHWILSFALI